ncbi:rab-GTPase-TBC domain-containing protein [Cryomyces antarcticus]
MRDGGPDSWPRITKANSGRDHLKALRYEDTATAKAPIRTRTGSPTSPSSSSTPPLTEDVSERSRIISDIQRLPFKVRYHPPVEVKRDSGIAPSTSTTGTEFNAESTSNSGGISKVPSVPAVVAQDESLPVRTGLSQMPFSRRRTSEARVPDAPASSLKRSGSFKRITTSIPTGDFDDFTSPDRLEFSNRGSILFGGKKMNDAIGNQPNGPVGLVSGRRKPSVHMTQYVPQEPRALSAEAVIFSEKVRSMYEHGDEKAAEWTRQQGPLAMRALKNLRQDDTPLSQGDCQTLKVDKTRGRAVDQASSASATNRRESGIKKRPFETAGGIEDWEDVDGQEVDRYGFIIPKKQLSRGASPEPQAIQRVSTALKLASESPRQKRMLHRGPSSAKSSRSAAPSRASSALSVRPPGSCSGQGEKSGGLSSNPFRFRDRRLMDEASDMLTLPPGFSDIAEEDESGRAVTTMKEREFNREEKWRKMARITAQTTVKGGGMTFSFDTCDPKVISRTWKGIPDRWRASAWHSFLSSSAKARGAHASDEDLMIRFQELQEQSSIDDVQIDLDVPRTINMHIMFRRRYRGGQRLLFRVLHALSLYFPETGYVQGMASLAATLLCYYDEEKAFVMLVRLWQLRGLERLYEAGFQGLMEALKEFEDDWLAGDEVAQKLEELDITSTAYGTRWYLTLFNMSIPFPAQLRVWDVFMLLGDPSPHLPVVSPPKADLDVLHATSAALIDATRDIILSSDFEDAMKVLTSWIPVKDEDLLMEVARVEWKMRRRRGQT